MKKRRTNAAPRRKFLPERDVGEACAVAKRGLPHAGGGKPDRRLVRLSSTLSTTVCSGAVISKT